MKSIAVVLTIAAFLSCPSIAAPGEGGWSTTGSARLNMMAHLGSSDGPDGTDLATAERPWIAGSYHSADEWGSSAGFYEWDLRAPLLPGETKTWMLYIWGLPGRAVADFHADWAGSSDPSVTASLEYVQKPAGVTGGPALGTVWTTPPYDFTLPIYTTDDGLTGYGFRFTLTMVPEPSSLLALVSCLGGMAVLIRQRRR